ncbi:hypothetical protein C8R44DRAFT_561201, partial [Mycena epipterygia]
MTDYTAQGKSRPQNPVELTYCNDHKAYYVALSRGFTAEGTVIIQRLDVKKITSGMSGYLRQELRELEILDEITRLRVEGVLPPSVTGLYRRRLLRTYYSWKADHRDPSHFHPAMRWKSDMGPRVPEAVVYSEWKPTLPENKKRKRPVRNTVSHIVGTTARLDAPSAKKTKAMLNQTTYSALTAAAALSDATYAPYGLIWDSTNYSCAYDAVFTVLANLWRENIEAWSARFASVN